MNDDTFSRGISSGFGKESDGSTWTLASGQGTILSIEPSTGEVCPMSALILETDEGIALWDKYMTMGVTTTTYSTTSTMYWHCAMCGASGEGRVPYFHDKPITQEGRAQ